MRITNAALGRRYPGARGADLYLFDTDSKSYVEPIKFKKAPDFPVAIPATSYLSDEVMQNLLDELWKLGFRPNDGTGNAGQLAATSKHLEDMRTIAFSKLDLYLPEKIK